MANGPRTKQQKTLYIKTHGDHQKKKKKKTRLIPSQTQTFFSTIQGLFVTQTNTPTVPHKATLKNQKKRQQIRMITSKNILYVHYYY